MVVDKGENNSRKHSEHTASLVQNHFTVYKVGFFKEDSSFSVQYVG